ncbi:hypothetical protein BG011_003796 [Mortierella polycephala]|uniref:Uncharacterized protein n=1 Tax=Mortierella polycephala TaxID=41804 RepID=A0A9P6U3J2_9FUNG|nr:hypothetical protein BG011_003796 [Mortierella polycephala]
MAQPPTTTTRAPVPTTNPPPLLTTTRAPVPTTQTIPPRNTTTISSVAPTSRTTTTIIVVPTTTVPKPISTTTTTASNRAIPTIGAGNATDGGDGMSGGAIAGLIVGALAVLIGSIFGGFMLLKQRKKRLDLVGRNNKRQSTGGRPYNQNRYSKTDMERPPMAAFRRENHGSRPNSGYAINGHDGSPLQPHSSLSLNAEQKSVAAESGLFDEKRFHAARAGVGAPRMPAGANGAGIGAGISPEGESNLQMNGGVYGPYSPENANPKSPMREGYDYRLQQPPRSVELNPEQLERERVLDLKQQERAMNMAATAEPTLLPTSPTFPSRTTPLGPSSSSHTLGHASFGGPHPPTLPHHQQSGSYYPHPPQHHYPEQHYANNYGTGEYGAYGPEYGNGEGDYYYGPQQQWGPPPPPGHGHPMQPLSQQYRPYPPHHHQQPYASPFIHPQRPMIPSYPHQDQQYPYHPTHASPALLPHDTPGPEGLQGSQEAGLTAFAASRETPQTAMSSVSQASSPLSPDSETMSSKPSPSNSVKDKGNTEPLHPQMQQNMGTIGGMLPNVQEKQQSQLQGQEQVPASLIVPGGDLHVGKEEYRTSVHGPQPLTPASGYNPAQDPANTTATSPPIPTSTKPKESLQSMNTE